jgi:hypothetical protein
MALRARDCKRYGLQQCWLRLRAGQIYGIISCTHLITLRFVSYYNPSEDVCTLLPTFSAVANATNSTLRSQPLSLPTYCYLR